MALSIVDLSGQCQIITIVTRPKLNKKTQTVNYLAYRCDRGVVATVTAESCDIMRDEPVQVCRGHLSLAERNAKRRGIPLYP